MMRRSLNVLSAMLFALGISTAGLAQSNNTELHELLNKATQGDARAQFILGVEYIRTNEEYRDYQKGIKWLEKAAAQNYREAEAFLEVLYEQGRANAPNVLSARKRLDESIKEGDIPPLLSDIDLVEREALQGDDLAQYALGYIYFEGVGRPVDYKKALDWFMKSAQQGNIDSYVIIGGMYLLGFGVSQDKPKASVYYKKAADKNDPRAQTSLGMMYENGDGVRQDYKEALKWYTKAAEQGVAASQLNLAILYANGLGAPINHIKSKEWFGKACDNGIQRACDAYLELKKAGM